MSSLERPVSRDQELVRSRHSFSQDGRMSSIPMWDSSDPERAPPPLPLNPGSPSLTTRPNTSAAIAATAKALEQKARENAPSAYVTNPMPEKTGSPERSLIKGAAHKRMQSLQTPSVRDLRSYLDGAQTPERSPERPSSSRAETPSFSKADKESIFGSPDKSPVRLSTPTHSTSREYLKDTPSLRPTSRSQHKALLGENTPPSATMLALQAMPIRELEPPPLANITNSSSPRAAAPQPGDGLSVQIREIANLCAGLQKEMAQLSRRSKDNATDLLGLKEATNSRDEDIRKSLKELVNNFHGTNFIGPPPPGLHTRSGSFTGASTPPQMSKSFSLPHFSSPTSMLDERMCSPNPYSVEGAASVAMLEKIIREMVTKEGQERLVNTLNGLFDKANHDSSETVKNSSETVKKVGELVEFIKQGSQSQAIVQRGGGGNGDGTGNTEAGHQDPDAGPVARVTRDINAAFGVPNDANSSKPYSSPKAADFVSADMLKLLKKIKDSVTETGGVTAEVKALLRDLRGEVLGMGRELGRKIDEVTPNSSGALAIEDGQSKEDVGRIIREGLAELQEHMDQVLREKRRQSSGSVVSRANSVDSQEVHQVVKHALAQRGIDSESITPAHTPLDRDAILSAVKEAYNEYKPEIELQQYGLERDEILECLREGLEDYRSSAPRSEAGGMGREEIMDAVAEAMQHYPPPQPNNEAAEIREEVLGAVRECLDEFKPSMQVAPLNPGGDITRGVVLEAIREGMEAHAYNGAGELEINRDDLFDAVRTALEGQRTPFSNYGEQVLSSLKELVDSMRQEFKAYSSANGRDTEQVLDAVKDGLESLRGDIEVYVDRSQDVTGKDEIVDTVRGGLEALRIDVQGFVAAGPQGDQALNRNEMLAYIKSEFDHLHEAMSSQMVAPSGTKDKEEILLALHEGMENLNVQMSNRAADESSSEEMQEAMKQEFEQLREVILSGTASHRDEILDTIHASLENLHMKLESQNPSSESNEGEIATMTEEFKHLRETIGATMLKAGAAADKDDLLDAVRESMDAVRIQITSDQGETSKETMGAIKEELENLRESLSSSLVKDGSAEHKEEILEALRIGLDEIREANAGSNNGVNQEFAQALQVELERLRSQIAGNVAARADIEEVLETVRLGLDDLRSHLEKRIDSPDRHMQSTGEILDALNDGLEGLRTDIGNVSAQPIDMSVSYEILETLKEGISSIHADIARLKGDKQATVEDDNSFTGNEVVLAEDPGIALSREMPMPAAEPSGPAESLRRNDLEKVEVMLTQLQIKVEAMDDNIQNQVPQAAAPTEPAPGIAMKEDLMSVEDLLRDIQATVVVLSERESAPVEGMARKEDTDAIETLLQNTRAKLDEIVLPDPEATITKEHLDGVEAAVRQTGDVVDALAAKFGEDVASKGDVAVVEVLVGDLKTALEELRAAQAPPPTDEEIANQVTKTDVELVGVLCAEIKDKFDALPTADALPLKADVEQLVGLIHDFRDSHDKLKDSYESDVAVTAQAFDDRKKESEMLVENISGVKAFLEEVKEEIKAKIQEGGEGMEGVKDCIHGLEENITNFNVTADVKELMETVNREFERTHGSIDGLKTEGDERSASHLEKHDEVKAAIVAAITEKLDEKFDSMMSKYDDMLILAESQAQKIDEKTTAQEELLASTKTMADELKLTIDTLGSSVMTMGDTFTEASQKMNGDSTNVFGRVDEAVTKLDENHAETKAEHQLTRDEVAKALTAIDGLQGDITENHPKFMVTLQEVLALVSQHYEHSQKSQEAAQEHARAAAEESEVRAREIKESFSGLPALMPPPPPPVEPIEQYDDTQLHEKLDTLLGHATDAEKSAAQLERLDSIHAQVMATAAEVTQFVTTQTRLITEGHESKEKEAEEAALLLERRLVQKDQIEADMHNLNDEKETLHRAVEELRSEKDSLAAQKSRLNADVSALEMALNIRREELQAMDSKADALERRILNGIMDHSRALLLQKGVPAASATGVRSAADLDRERMPPPSTAARGLTMALNPRPAMRRNKGMQAPANPADRRILSLSQISGNAPSGNGLSLAGMGMPGLPNTGLKRSHSVKTNPGRKTSWTGAAARRVSGTGKENGMLNEEDEHEASFTNAGVTDMDMDADNDNDAHNDNDASDAGTERRHSFITGTGTGTDIASSYGTGSYTEGATPDERRGSFGAGASEYTYGTGSYMTGSEADEVEHEQDDRRTSFGTTALGNVAGDEGASVSGDEAEESEAETQSASEGAGTETAGDETVRVDSLDASAGAEAPVGLEKDHVFYAAPSDSGLGSDLPTAAVGHGSEMDYFRRRAEEEASQVSQAP